jgi:hypothetical protein
LSGGITEVGHYVGMLRSPDNFSKDFVGDPTGDGVWIVEFATTGAVAIHLDSSGNQRAYPIGRIEDARAHADVGIALAVAPDGTIWVGEGDGLLSRTPTGRVRRYIVPINAHSTFTGVTAVAVTSDGRVAVGLSASNNMLFLNPTTGAFTGRAIPGEEGVDTVVSLSNGRLAIGRGLPGQGVGEIDLDDPIAGDRVLATHAVLGAGFDDTIITDDDTRLQTTRLGTSASTDQVTSLPTLPDLQFPLVAATSATATAVGLHDGMATLTATGWAQTRPFQPCPSTLGMPRLPELGTTGPTTTNAHPVCPPIARAVALDGAGHRWLLTTGDSVFQAT